MKYSKQRDLILDIVKKQHTHPTAAWVHAEAKKTMPSIGIATVYRNLNQLSEMGEIQRIDGVDGLPDRFDGMTEEHYHMRCPMCGGLTDLTVQDQAAFSAFKKAFVKSFSANEEELTLATTLCVGRCAACADGGKPR